MSQKIVLFIVTGMRTSNLIYEKSAEKLARKSI
jgi:hypothetical protein